MSWVWALLLAAVALGLVLLLMRWMGKPTLGWEAIGAALLLGIAGYGLQGSPGLPGAPKEPVEKISDDPAALVAARKALNAKPGPMGDNQVVTADAFARHGQFADAAGILLGAVDKNPNDADAWLALANALFARQTGVVRRGWAIVALVCCQAGLGIATLVWSVPLPVALAHQAFAMLVLGMVVANLRAAVPVRA